jgi:uncharacterized RDD family membrane protein YckC
VARAASLKIKPAKSLERELITPEGVDLRLRLGEASERAAALLIDFAIMFGILVALTLVAILAMLGTKGGSAEVIAVIWMLGAFVLRNLYFVLFELTPQAATPGKRLLGLRVTSRNGGRLTADAIFGRNVMRELEIYLPITFLLANSKDVDGWLQSLGLIWCGVFLLFPLFNRDRLRVGDIVAGTMVVKSPKRTLLKDLAVHADAATGRFHFTDAQLDAYGVKELHVLEDVLRRYSPSIVAAVAERIRAKIGWVRGAGEGDGAFLDAYYRALRGRLESKLLFGRWRKDKHDSP